MQHAPCRIMQNQQCLKDALLIGQNSTCKLLSQPFSCHIYTTQSNCCSAVPCYQVYYSYVQLHPTPYAQKVQRCISYTADNQLLYNSTAVHDHYRPKTAVPCLCKNSWCLADTAYAYWTLFSKLQANPLFYSGFCCFCTCWLVALQVLLLLLIVVKANLNKP